MSDGWVYLKTDRIAGDDLIICLRLFIYNNYLQPSLRKQGQYQLKIG